MPNQDQMLFIRPKNCHDCGHGYYGLLHVVEYAQSKGLWTITDLSAQQAEKQPVYETISNTDPLSIYLFGHGHNCRVTGDSETDIWNCDECNNLSSRLCYFLSCLTAIGLGPEIIRQGALAYAGFNISWTWVSEGGTDGDPYLDKYARCFWESANELWIALCDGYEFMDAVQRSIDKYTEWIDYWFYTDPDADSAEDCIMWLAYDRDGLVALDECMLKTTQTECETSGCHWYNNMCNSLPEQPTQPRSLSLVPLIPVIAIVGIMLIVGTTSKKKKR